MTPIAYLCCTHLCADLDSRLLLGAQLLDRGIAVVIGQRWAIEDGIKHLPKGCFVYNTADEETGMVVDRARAAGHAVVLSHDASRTICEPSLMASGVGPASMAAMSAFCSHSPAQSQVLAQTYPRAAAFITTTGSPRTDLASPWGAALYDAEARELSPTPYVLLVSNFSMERETRDLVRSAIEWVLKVSANDVVILTGHGENIDPWGGIRKLSNRVKLLERQNWMPWLMRADIVMHTDSPAGLDAAMLRRPQLNLCTDTDTSWHKAYIIGQIAPGVGTMKEVVAALMTAIEAAGRARVHGSAYGLPYTDLPALNAHMPGWQRGVAASGVADVVHHAMETTMEYPPHLAKAVKLDGAKLMTAPQRAQFYITRREMEARMVKIADAFGLCKFADVITRDLTEAVVLMVKQ